MRQVQELVLPPRVFAQISIFVLTVLLVLAPGRAALGDTEPPFSMLSLPEELLSTNWFILAEAALPAKFRSSEIRSFQETTNLLCEASRRDNYPAKTLWGFVLVVESRSPEATEEGVRLLRSAAVHRFIPAMSLLGWLFEWGQYVRPDHTAAFRWYTLLAKGRIASGEFHLGWCYHHAVGTSQDLKKAAEFYARAAEQNNFLAMKSIGFMLLDGVGVKQDANAAKYWFDRAAKKGGSRRAMLNLGILCAKGAPGTNAPAEAFRWFLQSAELGDPLACFAVSDSYSRGWGVESNWDNCRAWRLKAAELGSTEAEYQMGAACQVGDGVPKNEDVSFAWYSKAAAKNHPRALYELARYYLRQGTNQPSQSMANQFMLRAAGEGHREAQFQYAARCFRGEAEASDAEAGERWLAKAASSGWGPAEMSLGLLQLRGASPAPGCRAYPKDMAEGLKLLRRAAEHHDLQAESVLGLLLVQGKDLRQDKREGEKLLHDAAQHGLPLAQNDLGFLILSGATLTSNRVEAAMWCRLAEADKTDPKIAGRAAMNAFHAITEATEEERLEVEQRVRAFRPLPVEKPDALMKDWENSTNNYRNEDGLEGAMGVQFKQRMSKP